MGLGRHLRELWHMRAGVVLGALLALLVAVWSVARVEVLPPGLHARSLDMAAASTRALVDTPKTMVLDMRVNTANIDSITNRALLVGNVMATAPVRQFIARRAGVDAGVLQVASPVTPAWPRPLASSGKRRTSDLLKSPEEYRISIQVNPTVPIVDVYAIAPTPRAAEHLANGAVDGMRDYLRSLGRQQGVPRAEQIHLEQLGQARGALVNPGVSAKVATLTFLIVFAASMVALLFIARVRRGWRLEARSEQILLAPGAQGRPTP